MSVGQIVMPKDHLKTFQSPGNNIFFDIADNVYAKNDEGLSS